MRRAAGVLALACACGGTDAQLETSALQLVVVVGRAQYQDGFTDAQREQARAECEAIHAAAELYVVQEGRAPADVATLVAAKALARPMLDPWGNDYAITAGDPLRVRSPGPDGQAATADDIACTP